MAVNDLWIIAVKTITYTEPAGTKVDMTLSSGTTVKEGNRKEDPLSGVWIKCKKPHSGWFLGIAYSEDKIEEYKAAMAQEDSKLANAEVSAEDKRENEDPIDIEDVDSEFLKMLTDSENKSITYNIEDSDFVNIKNIAGVFGLPYQFLPTADPRIVTTDRNGQSVTSSDKIGYEYANKIVERMPLLFLAPGRPAFLKKYSRNDTKTLLGALIQSGLGGIGQDNDELMDLLSKEGRYYTFEYKTSEYYTYVNPLCRAASIYLGIDDIVLPGANAPLQKLDWEKFTDTGISSIGDFGTYRSIPFYVDSETSISENFSNSTTASQLGSIASQASDMAREINFLVGMSSTALGLDSIVSADTMENNENLDAIIKRLTNTGVKGFVEKIGSHLSVVASGGKMYFPEIWNDSSFSRSYNCTFKFIAPDPSNLSVYLNVLVPLFHLIGLVGPQTAGGNINAYSSPFLVRAIYKGMFNIDTGIITNMSVTKGGDCQWTKNGIPTSIEVNIEIKDLYNVMAITPTTGGFDFGLSVDTLNNTALMDYVANLCGINIFKPETRRTIEMWYTLNLQNKLGDFIQNNIWGNIQDKVQNLIMGIYR